MSKRSNLYIGSSGQLAVMAEFLARGYNAAVPQVDVGDDILVVRDSDGDVSRIQVKTATARPSKHGYSASFNVSKGQLSTPQTPDLTYVFVIRHQEHWSDYILIQRAVLDNMHANDNLGSASKDRVVFRLAVKVDKGVVTVSGNKCDLSCFKSDWSRWPKIAH